MDQWLSCCSGDADCSVGATRVKRSASLRDALRAPWTRYAPTDSAPQSEQPAESEQTVPSRRRARRPSVRLAGRGPAGGRWTAWAGRTGPAASGLGWSCPAPDLDAAGAGRAGPGPVAGDLVVPLDQTQQPRPRFGGADPRQGVLIVRSAGEADHVATVEAVDLP